MSILGKRHEDGDVFIYTSIDDLPPADDPPPERLFPRVLVTSIALVAAFLAVLLVFAVVDSYVGR